MTTATPNPISLTPASVRASFSLPDERTAKRTADLLAEGFDNNDAAIAAFETPAKRWDIMLNFARAPDEASVRALVALATDDAVASTIRFERVEATDWVKASLDGLAAVCAGRFVVHGAHHRDRVAPNQIGIEIEAALAFGTGHHGTTRGCLLLLDALLKHTTPHAVLDLGTGTGVLAIAAARATHRKMLASDIDRVSVKVARENATANRAGNTIEMIHASGFASPRFAAHAPFDLILANILANPLRRLARPMSLQVTRNANVILSGLLPDQTNAVISSYRSVGLTLRRRIVLDGWASLWIGN